MSMILYSISAAGFQQRLCQASSGPQPKHSSSVYIPYVHEVVTKSRKPPQIDFFYFDVDGHRNSINVNKTWQPSVQVVIKAAAGRSILVSLQPGWTIRQDCWTTVAISKRKVVVRLCFKKYICWQNTEQICISSGIRIFLKSKIDI